MPQVQPNAPGTLRQLAIAMALTLPAFGSPLPVSAADTGEQNTAKPQSVALNFNIPAQPLVDALNAFIAVSDWQVGFPAGMAKDVRSSAVHGRYTPQQALQQLLTGSGLRYRLTGANTVTLENAPQSQTDMPVLKAMTVVGEAVKDVDDPDNGDYQISNAVTATKTDTPIMETPYAVQVVPKQVLRDQQVVRVEDAVKNVAGARTQPTNGQMVDTFILRGFATDTLYRNGFPLPSSPTRLETANLERIEVLKGPGSLLYGRTEPGGIVNLVTKKPQAIPYHSLQQQFGSYDFYRTTIDSTGAITDDEDLLYRVNLAYENADSFRDFQKTDRVFVAPSLTWDISDQTQANIDIEYQHFDDTGDSGIPPIGNRPAPVPINREIGEYVNNSNVGDRVYTGFNWSHAFNDDWKFTQRFGAEFWDYRQLYLFFFTPATATGDLNSRRFNNADRSQKQEYYTTLNLTGKFNTGVLEHTLLTGFDYFVVDKQIDGNCCTPAPAFNIFHPTYLTTAPVFDPANNYPFETSEDWYGLYIQDQVKLPYNVFANFGLRYDNATSEKDVETTDDHVSPRGGLLWKPMEWLSVYGSYSENFGLSNSLFIFPGQKALPPQTAQQWELGTKTEFMDGRWSATFAYFDLTKQNLVVSDYSCTPFPCQNPVGEMETQGYELEVAGEILPGWNIIGAYTHMAYANINKDGLDGVSGNTGNRIFNTPRNFGSLWNTYDFQSAELHGLKVGGGVSLRPVKVRVGMRTTSNCQVMQLSI
jgi:iron complex outermembrane receptor protein